MTFTFNRQCRNGQMTDTHASGLGHTPSAGRNNNDLMAAGNIAFSERQKTSGYTAGIKMVGQKEYLHERATDSLRSFLISR